jgi:pimeloyl-ACP methyl ester carboxylesterase
MAERDVGAVDTEGERLVGPALAVATARRWFVPAHHSGSGFEEIRKVVAENSLEGFKRSVEALYEYDLRPLMKDGRVKGLFVVGGGDGVLPQTMPEMARAYGVEGTKCEVVEEAGHLPMMEQPERFSGVISSFLN